MIGILQTELTDEQRQALGDALSHYLEINAQLDWCDSRNIDDLINTAICPAISKRRAASEPNDLMEAAKGAGDVVFAPSPSVVTGEPGDDGYTFTLHSFDRRNNCWNSRVISPANSVALAAHKPDGGDVERIRNAGAILDCLTSNLSSDHPLRLEAAEAAKRAVADLYRIAEQFDATISAQQRQEGK